MTPFTLTPAQRPTPLVVEVPHAGLEIPAELRGPTSATVADLRRDADLAVDELWAGAPARGAPLLAARWSRYLCDLNRDPDDVDARAVADHPFPRDDAPRGFIWRATTDGRAALARPLTHAEWSARVDRVWRPYHDALAGLLDAARRRHGFAVLLSGHSMPSVGRALHEDPGRRRADVVPGVRGGAACAPALLDEVVRHFSGHGLGVAVDDPYRGGATTARYGRPREHLHAIQIELSRALYLDERRVAVVPERAARVRGLLDDLVERLSALKL